MPPPEAELAVAPRAGVARAHQTSIGGWGGGPRAAVRLSRPASLEELRVAVAGADRGRGAVARGLGRSYGDAAQLTGGLVLEGTALRRHELDADAGTVTVDSGVTVGDLLRELVPAGWILPVVPGTQHVTVGGAIASDIHGKNHVSAGSFGAHVQALGLLRSDGELITLEPGDPDELFEATIGGMGLTGFIAWARLGLQRTSGATLAVDTERVDDLDHAFAALLAADTTHRVAWLDLLSGRNGRGVVTRAEPVASSRRDLNAGAATVRARVAVPARWQRSVLHPVAVRAFNEVRFRRTPRSERGRLQDFGAFSFPLDALDRWPRLYGPQGLVQYQCVVPRGRESALEQLIERQRPASVPCFLAVLKLLGPAARSPLSFPLSGFTLALDLPRAAPGLESLLRAFDELVAEAGGRVYLTKDARLGPAALGAMYPRLDEWRGVQRRADPGGLWRSDLGLRTGLVGSP